MRNILYFYKSSHNITRLGISYIIKFITLTDEGMFSIG